MKRRGVSLVILFSLALAEVARAAEDAHHHEGGAPSMWPVVYSAINLAIFVWVLSRFAMPTVRAWVRERRDRIVTELQAAADAKTEAQRLRAEWETRIAQLDQTIATMRTQARQDAEHERERILAAARQAAETIRRDAERAAAYELRRTQEQLRAELVRQAVHLAEDAARRNWTAADQQRSLAEFLKEVQP